MSQAKLGDTIRVHYAGKLIASESELVEIVRTHFNLSVLLWDR
jgi:hypothetical protein